MLPVAPRSIILATVLAAAFAAGWSWRGSRAEAELAALKLDLTRQAADQRDLAMRIEAGQDVITRESGDRLDQQAEQQQKEIEYVDREVIKYRDRWRDVACRLPDDWLRLYNTAIGTEPMPAPTAARQATD